MKRTVLLGLNKVPQVPASLQQANTPLDKVDVSISKLSHHMFLDTHGDDQRGKPKLLAAHNASLITATKALEFMDHALGTHKEAKVAENMKWGKAFCRWMLAEHFGVIHFAHMDHILDKTTGPLFAPVNVVRLTSGNTPDYLCGDAANRVTLSEAKGRNARAISFNNTAFQEWRDQVQRVQVQNQQGQPLKVKSYIVATRLRTEGQGSRVRSKVFVEDPETPGDEPPSFEDSSHLNRIAITHHYGAIFDRLGLPLHAAALFQGFGLDGDGPIQFPVWSSPLPQLTGRRFVGGFLYDDNWLHLSEFAYRFYGPSYARYDLRQRQAAFFGLDIDIFRRALAVSREGPQQVQSAEGFQSPVEGEFPPLVSLMRDGSLVTTGAFMQLVDIEEF